MKSPTLLLLIALPMLGLAQTKPEPRNFLVNGSFESFLPADNLWDGVDGGGYLAGARGGSDVISERGAVESVPMAISVQAGDLNADGLVDLLTVDMEGYFRVYFNSGTKTEPKFTTCEMIPIYLARLDWLKRRLAMKACLYDLNRDGTLDLVLGSYGGEIMMLRNTGSTRVPEFRQPFPLETILVRTSKSGNLWGNVFAPAMWEWTGTGKADLLIGEGSYSANAIHLLVNQGNTTTPRFNEERRYYLAYGDGREQLVPAVVDYNGDGEPDLIVGDRKGTLNVYLSDGPWNSDKELKFATTIACGTVSSFNGCIAPAVADLNGDGLFDLLIGKTNGRIAIAYNRGTKQEPKFDTPVELKGEDFWGRGTIRNPSGWAVDFGTFKGNIYGYVTVVKQEEEPKEGSYPDGKHALKAGYLPPLNKIIRYAPLVLPAYGAAAGPADLAIAPNAVSPLWDPLQAVTAGFNTDNNMVIVRKVLENTAVKPGVEYALSFKVKGRGVKDAHWHLSYRGSLKRSESRITERVGRGVRMQHDVANEALGQEADFTVGTGWTTVARNLTFKFVKEPVLNKPEGLKNGPAPNYWLGLEIRATLNPGDGVFYLDDVKLVEANAAR